MKTKKDQCVNYSAPFMVFSQSTKPRVRSRGQTYSYFDFYVSLFVRNYILTFHKGNHKRKCQCDTNGCSWSGSDVYCVTRVTTTEPISSTVVPITSTISSTMSANSNKVCGEQQLFDINGAWFCNEDNIKNGSVCKLRGPRKLFSSTYPVNIL